MNGSILVESSPGSGVLEVTRHIAERFGAAIVTSTSGDGRNRIWGVELPQDPPLWAIEAVLLRALGPSHILFLCVANSARSQIAEGLARSMAPEGVRISSAGSEPSSVRPQAIEVLREVGIDITGHRSRGVGEVERPVDVVITLCAEEVCPVWLADAGRVHWGLPDPASTEGSADAKLDAFRAVRDELLRRFSLLFG